MKEAAPTADHSLAYDQKHFIDLVETMLEYEPEKRPTALQTNHELVELGGENQIFHEGCCRKTPTQLASMRGSIVKILKEDRAAQTCEAHELRTRLSQLQKERDTKDAKVQELEIVRNLFESSIEKARMDTARSWARLLDAGKKRGASKELDAAQERVKKLEEENQKLRAHKDDRLSPKHRDQRPDPSNTNRDRSSTPSRLPVMRNSSSPLTPPRPFKPPTASKNSKSESDLISVKFTTSPQNRENDDSDANSLMAASGTLLLESRSSFTPTSSSPPSPSMSKSIAFEVPNMNDGGKEAPSTKIPIITPKSYADILRPAPVAGNGVKKNVTQAIKSVVPRGPVYSRNMGGYAGKT